MRIGSNLPTEVPQNNFKYVIATTNGLYYTGIGFDKDAVKGLKFDTRQEAEKRIRLRSDWTVKEIEVEAPTGYLFERVLVSALGLLLLLFAGNASAQTFSQSYHSGAITSQNGTAKIVSGDLRQLGYSDLIVSQNSQICVLLNNGDGTFATPNCFGTAATPTGMALADVNRDGKLDLVVLEQKIVDGDPQGQLWIYISDGAGGFAGSSQNAPASAGPGAIQSGPFIGNFDGGSNNEIVVAGDNCTNASINFSLQPLNTTTVAVANAVVTNSVFPSVNMPGCGGMVFGAMNEFVIGNNFIYNSSGVQSYSLCAGPLVAVIGSYVIPFQAAGNACIQEPPSTAVVGGGTFNLSGDQSVVELFSIVLGGSQTGLMALISSPTSKTPILFLSGSDLLHLNQNGSVSTNLTLPTVAVSDIFRPNGTTAQDIAVLDQNGLTVLTQGTFSGVFSSSSLTFPAQAIGSSATQQVKFTNTGTGTLTPFVISLTGSSDFTQASDCPTSLPASAFCTVTVQFLPGSVELSSQATLTATSKLVTQSISLTGSEILFVAPVPNQASLTFGNQLVGTTSPTQTVQLANNGNESFTTTISVSNNFTETNTCSTVAAGSTCNIIVGFDPTTSAVLTGSVSITTIPTGSASINLTGTGVAAASITTPLANQTVVSGNPVSFTVVASGTAPLTYVWKKNNVVVGTNSPTLTFTTAASDNAATIAVTVTNAYGQASSTATLTVLTVPVITTQPTSTAVTLGQTATFNVVAQGSVPLSYAWTKAGLPVGSNSSTYTTAPAISSDNGAIVNVTVTNNAGHAISGNAVLTVDFPSSISQQPTNQTVTLSSPGATANATFVLVAVGTNNSYQWQRNQADIPSANSSTLVFSASASNNGDTFRCVVSDPFGPSVTSNTVTLTVNIPPAIVNQTPVGGNTVIVPVGSTTTMSANVSGTQPLTFSWQHQGIAIPNANASTYTTPALTAADDRTSYTLTVSNAFGTATSLPWSVGVVSAPVITAKSADPSVNVGQSATFSVNYTTNDGATATFVWTHNNLPAASTGPSLTINNLQTSDSGTVQLIVSDIGGQTTVSWSLSVATSQPAFTLSLAPSTITVAAGKSASYTLQVVDNTGGIIALSCATTVPAGSCSLSSNSVGASGRSNVVVTTPLTAFVPITPIRIINWPMLFLILVAGTAFITRPRYSRQFKLAVASAALALMIGGCGAAGANSIPPPPPPPPTSHSYTVSVTGTMTGNASVQATATLVVTN